MTERTTVRLPGELLTRARRKAADEGRSLTSLIEEGLRRVVAETPQVKERVIPRVSKAKGWLAPGISSLKEAEERDEMEYIDKILEL